MSSQQARRQSRGENTQPPPPRNLSSNPQTTGFQAGQSVEGPDQGRRSSQTSSSTSNDRPFFRIPQSPRSLATESIHPPGAKVAIPRLERPIDVGGDDSLRSGGRHRVNHACQPCRHRKTKCSGERPICRHCQDFNITCFWADGKRDRVKKQFGSMTEKVTEYEKLLKDLQSRVNENDAKLIKMSLDKQTIHEADESGSENVTVQSIEPVPTEDESGAESDASAGAGSTGALDRTDEDFTREQAKDTGFMGKNSEITWLQRLRQENKYGHEVEVLEPGRIPAREAKIPPRKAAGMSPDETVPLAETDDGFSVKESSYHLDDLAVSIFEAVNPYDCPPIEVAERFFHIYMTKVHPTFPIVGRTNLTIQFRKYISGQVQRPPERWLAIINMIFAIGAKYSHLVKADWCGNEKDDLLYFNRARMLSMNAETIFQHADLQSIQVSALMAFYFLCISQINRAWTMSGLAVRWATALGMNMRNDSHDLKDSLKEIRYRLWWGLYALEHRLCCMTGRVNCIVDEHCTTPLPIPLEEDMFDTNGAQKLLTKEKQTNDRAPSANSHSSSSISAHSSLERSRSGGKNEISRSPSTAQRQPSSLEWAKDYPANSSLYFLHFVQLTRLTQNVFQKLYNPAAIEGSWSEIQDVIRDLGEQLENWYRTLPAIFDFKRKQRDREFYEYRLNLGFFYYSTKIMIHRPCLCRLDRKIPHQSTKSLEFNRSAATNCVDAARDMLQLIPDEPNAVGLMKVGPWWSVLHSIVQASTVLMLEISFRSHHMPEEADSLVEASKKGVRWLHALGEDNLSAQRAWSLCNSMLHDAVRKIGREITDLPQHRPGNSESSPQQDRSNMHMSNAQSGFKSQNMYMTPTPSNMADSSIFTNFDQMMTNDQYIPFNQLLNDHMSFEEPNNTDVDFMSSMTDMNSMSDFQDGQRHQQSDQTGQRQRYN